MVVVTPVSKKLEKSWSCWLIYLSDVLLPTRHAIIDSSLFLSDGFLYPVGALNNVEQL